MSSVVISGDTSGTVSLTVPAVAGTNTATLPAATGTVMVSGNQPAFNVYPSAAVSLNNGTSTLMTCNTKVFDTATAFNNTGSTVTLNGLSVPAYAFCPPVAGYYQINITSFLVAASGSIQPTLFKNGSTIFSSSCPNNSVGVGPTCSTVVYLNGTGDYLQFYSYQTSGGTVSTLASRPDLIGFSGSLVRTA